MRSTWAALLGLTSILFAPILPVIGQDVVTPSDPGSMTYDGGTAYSGSAQVGPEGSYLYFRKDFDNGVGYREGFSTVGGFMPLLLAPNYGFFAQGQLFVTDEGSAGGNLGGGYRYFMEEADRVLGAYGFLDFDESYSGDGTDQIGIGIETAGPMWDFRINGYFPLDTDNQFVRLNALTGPPVFSGNTVLLNGNAFFERTMTGSDMEFGVPLLDPSAFGRLRAYFGGYAYDGEHDDQIGGRVRLESHINEHVTLGAAFMHDDVNGDMVTMAVDIRGWSSALPGINNQQISNKAKMFLPVTRQYRIANDKFLKAITTPALDQNGDALSVVWVDNSNVGGGDGTFENPFTGLPSSAAGADYVLVREGNSSEGNPVLGGITLADNQLMYGEGTDFSIQISGTSFGPQFAGTYAIDDILPSWNTNGSNFPYLSNPGGDVITLANNNTVAGFNIVDSSGSGIRGDNISNFALSDLRIGSTTAGFGNGGAGILLVNASGTGTIENIELHNNALAGLWVDNTNTAPLTLTVEGSSGATPNVTGGDWGLILDADNSQITANVTNFRNSGSDDGLFLGVANAAVVNATLTNASFDNAATGNGINMIADNGSLSFNFTDVTADNAASAGLNALVTNGATFSGSISGTALGGSSFSDNGTDGVVLTVDSAAVGGNFLSFSQTRIDDNDDNGMNIDAINASLFTVNFLNGTINDNDDNNILTDVDGGSSLSLNVDPTDLNGAGLNGFRFNVNNGSSLFADFADVDILGSGQNGVSGTVNNGSTANVGLTNALISNSGGNGVVISALSATTTVTTNIFNSTLNNNTSDGINLLVDDAVFNLNMSGSGVSNTAAFGSQDNGLDFVVQNNGTFNGNLTNTGFFNNNGDGVRGDISGATSVANVTFNAATSVGSNGNGVNLIVDTGADLFANVNNGSDFSGNSNNGLLIDAQGVTTTATLGGTGFFNTYDNNGNAGVRIFADNVGAITANVVGGASENEGNGIEFEIVDVATIVDLRVNGGFSDNSRNGFNGILFDIENSNVTRLGVNSVVAEGNGTNGQFIPNNGAITNGVRFDLRDSTILAGSGISVNNNILDGNIGSGLNFELLNVNGIDASDISISGNQLSTNEADGFRFVNTVDTAPLANPLNVAFNNNFMEFNISRGMNVLNRANAVTTLTATGNLINLNEREGVYIVNTASATQSAEFGAPLQANGDVDAAPKLNLTFSFNEVTENGTAEGDTTVAAGGFVLRVGTSDGMTFADDGAASYTTDGGTASGGRGGVVATINSNTFTENEEADVWFDSFVSTVNPAATVGTWTDSNTNGVPGDDVFTVTTYEADPIARLDLVFTNNTGDELEATQGGASYSNAEARFKSRTNPLAGEAADGVGPFGTGTRERNAQRFAFRTGLPPTMAAGATFLFPGAGVSSFRVQQGGNVFTGGNGFILDVGPGVNALGVDAAGAAAPPVGGPQAIDFMPWGWSLLP